MARNEREMVEVIRFTPYTKKNSGLLGFATVRFENVAFSGVRLFENKEGEKFVKMPSEGPDPDHQYSTVWMAYEDKGDNREAYKMILEAILQHLHEEEPEKPVGTRRMNGSRL